MAVAAVPFLAGAILALVVTAIWFIQGPEKVFNTKPCFLKGSEKRADGHIPFLKLLRLPEWYDPLKWEKAEHVPGQNFVEIFEANKKDKTLKLAENQDEEDLILMKKYFNGVTNALMMESGAMDGQKYSVSRTFETLFGWRSILIEANTSLAAKMAANRPKALSFNAAICSEEKTVHFAGRDAVGVVPEFASEQFLRQWHPELVTTSGKKNFAEINKLPVVQCLPVGQILRGLEVKHLDVWVLDCEGCEQEALRSVDFNELRVDVLVVETNRFGKEENTQETIDIMKQYPFYSVAYRARGRNTWFVRTDFHPSPAPVVA